MAGEALIIRRDWNSSVIRVQIDKQGTVTIDTSIDAFENKLVKEILANLPSLSTKFSKTTIHRIVEDTVRKAFTDITQNMKDETIRVA